MVDHHVEILLAGVENWNQWRIANPHVIPSLSEVSLKGRVDLIKGGLRGINFRDANLAGANIFGVDLSGADLSQADLSGANLRGAILNGAKLIGANLSIADLSGGSLAKADLSAAKLFNTNFENAKISHSNFTNALIAGANFSGVHFHDVLMVRARVSNALFVDVDMRELKGFDSVEFLGPSEISLNTIIKSQGDISGHVLRGFGVPDLFIDYIGSLGRKPIQYYSCFISYSSEDSDFAERLHSDLQAQGVRCWFAPEDVKSGEKLHEQIDAAIKVYDKLLLILSPHSMKSEWVKTEIAKAQKREREQNKRMLFPVRLIDFDLIQQWESFDADLGRDSAREIREYYVPDFGGWKISHDKYKTELEKLLRDLKAN